MKRRPVRGKLTGSGSSGWEKQIVHPLSAKETASAAGQWLRLAGQLMLALHRCGRSADALSVYEATRQALDEQLGVDPGDALTALSRAVHRDDPALAAPGPASLPAATSSFVGRRRELAEAGELLAASRLLTLWTGRRWEDPARAGARASVSCRPSRGRRLRRPRP